jgi:hypothetical protein
MREHNLFFAAKVEIDGAFADSRFRRNVVSTVILR